MLLSLGREEVSIVDDGGAANEATGSSCLRDSRSSAIMALMLALLMRQRSVGVDGGMRMMIG